MSLISDATIVAGWRRISLQHITLVSGLAVALSGAVSFANWESTDDSATARRPLPRRFAVETFSADPVAPWHPAELPRLTIYIVGSEGQAGLMRAALLEEPHDRFAMDNPGPSMSPLVLLADSPQAESRVFSEIAQFSQEPDYFEKFRLVTIDTRAR